ncbi:nitric oxide reductase activation protein NorD [Brachymonas denitrificans]|uniref:Nitric oxide reductase NorD protein n=1 Tax=Brachymonas denitrificans DSM 15123 TaxID=1121117 RepID=A0A1H8I2C8_9BURK|nr:VWA domain-containing protein [Brachymonas denitrificans]SEN62619.1 nitric oxide reductase NorD protein [Brachymonas denitrificans DSM 15123]
MEEKVGSWWDSLIKKAAYRGYPQAAVRLDTMEKVAPVFFRAMGGNPALGLRSTVGTEHQGRRSLLERIAGTNDRVELAWADDKSLFLPEQIDLFPDKSLNRKLYFWLLALSAEYVPELSDAKMDWLRTNQEATQRCLAAMPGLAQVYQELVAAYIPLRGSMGMMPAAQAVTEKAIREALEHPGQPLSATVNSLEGIMPVHLWSHPTPPSMPAVRRKDDDDETDAEATLHNQKESKKQRRYRAKQAEQDERKNGPLMIFRAESIFTWDNFVKVNRHDDDDELGDLRAADDMDELAIARDTKKRSSRLKLDLDLPANAYDDTPLGPGILLPEWNYKTQQLVADHCCVQPMLPKNSHPTELPERLQRSAHRLRRQFQALAPQRNRRFGQIDGMDLDLDRVVRFFTEVKSGKAESTGNFYLDTPRNERSLACLLLADVSLSTEAWVGKGQQASSVIDVVKDSLMLFAEALQASGDAFGLYGFSSLKRKQVRYLTLKGFDESYNEVTRGRIAALSPGFYTRMGAAIRQSTEILLKQPAHKRLLLLVTDGKPNDLDHYEGRYGVEDTRQAVLEARKAGLVPFCVTIDREAGEYLPHLFGTHHYVVVPDATRLPKVLTRLYSTLSQ